MGTAWRGDRIEPLAGATHDVPHVFKRPMLPIDERFVPFHIPRAGVADVLRLRLRCCAIGREIVQGANHQPGADANGALG